MTKAFLIRLSIFTFCILTIMSACSAEEKVSLNEISRTPFEQFVDSIPSIKTPYSLSSIEQFECIEMTSGNIPDGANLIGKLDSKNGFHFIVYSYPADIQLPILEVYDANGEKINDAALFQYGACPITSDGHSKCTIQKKIIIRETTCDANDFNTPSDTIFIEELLKID